MSRTTATMPSLRRSRPRARHHLRQAADPHLPDSLDLVRRVSKRPRFCHTQLCGFPMGGIRAHGGDGDIGEIACSSRYVKGTRRLGPGRRGAARRLAHAPREDRLPPSSSRLGSPPTIWPPSSAPQQSRRFARVRTIVPGRNADDYAGLLFRSRMSRLVSCGSLRPASRPSLLHFASSAATAARWSMRTEPMQSFAPRPACQFSTSRSQPQPATLRAGRVGIGHPEGYQLRLLYAEAAAHRRPPPASSGPRIVTSPRRGRRPPMKSSTRAGVFPFQDLVACKLVVVGRPAVARPSEGNIRGRPAGRPTFSPPPSPQRSRDRADRGPRRRRRRR